jgi:hypothetical protein
MLLANLKRYGINDREGRDLVDRYPAPVLNALRYLRYRAAVSSGKAIIHPAQWLRRALADGYLFEEPAYQQWLHTQTAATTESTPLQLTSPSHLSPQPALPIPQQLTLPAGIWGEAIQILLHDGTITETTARMFFSDTTASVLAHGVITITAPDRLAADWITNRYMPALTSVLSTLAAKPITIEVSVRSTSSL